MEKDDVGNSGSFCCGNVFSCGDLYIVLVGNEEKKKVNKSSLSLLYKLPSFSSISLLLRLVNKIPKGNSNNIFGNWEFCFVLFFLLCVFLRMGEFKRMGWNMVFFFFFFSIRVCKRMNEKTERNLKFYWYVYALSFVCFFQDIDKIYILFPLH